MFRLLWKISHLLSYSFQIDDHVDNRQVLSITTVSLCYWVTSSHWFCHCWDNDFQIRISTWCLFFNLYLFKLFHWNLPWGMMIFTCDTTTEKKIASGKLYSFVCFFSGHTHPSFSSCICYGRCSSWVLFLFLHLVVLNPGSLSYHNDFFCIPIVCISTVWLLWSLILDIPTWFDSMPRRRLTVMQKSYTTFFLYFLPILLWATFHCLVIISNFFSLFHSRHGWESIIIPLFDSESEFLVNTGGL